MPGVLLIWFVVTCFGEGLTGLIKCIALFNFKCRMSGSDVFKSSNDIFSNITVFNVITLSLLIILARPVR